MPGSTAAFPHLIGHSIYGSMLDSFSLRNGDSFTVRDTVVLGGGGGSGGSGGSKVVTLPTRLSREAIEDAPGLTPRVRELLRRE